MSAPVSSLRLVPLSPRNEPHSSLSVEEIAAIHERLSISSLRLVPASVLRIFDSHKWKMFFTPFPSDHLGMQAEPYPTDPYDSRIWDDQIGGSCDAKHKSLYVSLFRATSKELTQFQRAEDEDLQKTLCHEIGHAFDAILFRIWREMSPDVSSLYEDFSTYAKKFRNAVWEDIITAGGVETLRHYGYGYYTPSERRPERHLEEVFAEGMALIWLGPVLQGAHVFRALFPRSLAVLKEINKLFCKTDFTNNRGRDEFLTAMNKMDDGPDKTRTYRTAVEDLEHYAHGEGRKVKFMLYLQWRMQYRKGHDGLLSNKNYLVAHISKFFANQCPSRYFTDPPKLSIGQHIKNYEAMHRYVHKRLADCGKPDMISAVRNILHELTAAIPHPDAEAALQKPLKIVQQMSGRIPDDMIMMRYLECHDYLSQQPDINKMEVLLLARIMHSYADVYRLFSTPAQGESLQSFLQLKRKAARKIVDFVDIMLNDYETGKGDQFKMHNALRAAALAESEVELSGDIGAPFKPSMVNCGAALQSLRTTLAKA